MVADYLFAAALGNEVGSAGKRGEGFVEILPEKDATAIGPLKIEGDGVFEDWRSVGEEAAIPEIGASPLIDVQRLGIEAGAAEIEAEGAGTFVFPMDDDDVAGLELGFDCVGELARGEDGREDLQTEVGGDEEDEGCGDETEIRDVGFVTAAEKPVGECAAEERDSGEDERIAEGGHGLGVEVEEMTEGKSVVAGILFEKRGEVGVGSGGMGVQDEEASDERGDRSDDEEHDRDALARTDEWVGDDEGFGFESFVVEPGGEEKDERRK